jgi:hypothetical protein
VKAASLAVFLVWRLRSVEDARRAAAEDEGSV